MSHLSEDELAKLAERERSHAGFPLTNWDLLSARLLEEGIIRDSGGTRWGASGRWLRAAAALILVSGGIAVGRITASGGSRASAGKLASSASPASASADSVRSFASEEQAWDVLNRAGADYQAASAFLASRDANMPADSTSIYQARLAALDGMTSASQKALYQAPHDPVINQYYLAAQGAREATIRQLSTALPSGVKLVKW